ncbi:MAG: DUF4263 domain-containing protein [Bacteroidetes bacterium]|nr:DUF4263 domain-containing protein [Bacteroidota bacterium]
MSNIEIEILDKYILLSYEVEEEDIRKYIDKKFEQNESINLRNTFYLKKENIYNSSESFTNEYSYRFILATKNKNFYEFDKKILSIENSLYIEENINITRKMFVAYRNISIFKKIDKVSKEDIYIVKNITNKDFQFPIFPLKEFKKLIKNFPNTTEIDKYTSYRIDGILSKYLLTDDSIGKYEKYLNKKPSYVDAKLINNKTKEYEKLKYEMILNKLITMLKDYPQKAYTEEQWKKEILEIILLLFPKYTHYIKEGVVHNDKKDKKVDFILGDINGNIDILEVKRPNGQIMRESIYRGSFTATKSLIDTVMQVEKYLYLLNKGGKNAETKLNDQLKKVYKKEKLEDYRLKIINPRGFIIMGLGNRLSLDQKKDYEIVRRQFKNIVDILTYDDLIDRLKNLVTRWS